MALNGGAFLALWNDIAPHREVEYDRWHTTEHVPERVAVTGFRGARRYVARDASFHRYFTLYEVADLAAFEHAEYVDVVRNPTPWSASMRPDFRNVVRATCRVKLSRGEGIGAAIAVLCYEQSRAPGHLDSLGALLDEPGVVGCHIGEGSPGPSAQWAQPAADEVPISAFDRVLLIEALDRRCASAALGRAQRWLEGALPASGCGCIVYDLAFAFPGHDANTRTAHRRASWPIPRG